MSQARTADDLRQDFIDACQGSAYHWATVPNLTDLERTRGVIHSLLSLIDGQLNDFTAALDLVARPHPDDKADATANGEDWIEDGTVLNADTMLHDLLHVRA